MATEDEGKKMRVWKEQKRARKKNSPVDLTIARATLPMGSLRPEEVDESHN